MLFFQTQHAQPIISDMLKMCITTNNYSISQHVWMLNNAKWISSYNVVIKKIINGIIVDFSNPFKFRMKVKKNGATFISFQLWTIKFAMSLASERRKINIERCKSIPKWETRVLCLRGDELAQVLQSSKVPLDWLLCVGSNTYVCAYTSADSWIEGTCIAHCLNFWN